MTDAVVCPRCASTTSADRFTMIAGALPEIEAACENCGTWFVVEDCRITSSGAFSGRVRELGVSPCKFPKDLNDWRRRQPDEKFRNTDAMLRAIVAEGERKGWGS